MWYSKVFYQRLWHLVGARFGLPKRLSGVPTPMGRLASGARLG